MSSHATLPIAEIERGPSRPGSSVTEQRNSNPEEAGSNPARGSNSWVYVVLRKELTGGAAISQAVHAAREASRSQAPTDERACVLVATKEQLAEIWSSLEAARFIDHHHSGSDAAPSFSRIVETDGPLAGSITAIGVVTRCRDDLRVRVPLLANLKVFR